MRIGFKRGRGFGIVVIFLLILVMSGGAAAVLLSMQADLCVVGGDRGKAIATNAAEAGVAYGRRWLETQAAVGGGGWTLLLVSNSRFLCVSPGINSPVPGIAPDPARNPFVTVGVSSALVGADPLAASAYEGAYRFCVHDDAADPAYLGNPPNGEMSDTNRTVTLESYGTGPEGGRARISVDVVVTGGGGGGGEYASGLGGPTKQAAGETVSATVTAGASYGTF